MERITMNLRLIGFFGLGLISMHTRAQCPCEAIVVVEERDHLTLPYIGAGPVQKLSTWYSTEEEVLELVFLDKDDELTYYRKVGNVSIYGLNRPLKNYDYDARNYLKKKGIATQCFYTVADCNEFSGTSELEGNITTDRGSETTPNIVENTNVPTQEYENRQYYADIKITDFILPDTIVAGDEFTYSYTIGGQTSYINDFYSSFSASVKGKLNNNSFYAIDNYRVREKQYKLSYTPKNSDFKPGLNTIVLNLEPKGFADLNLSNNTVSRQVVFVAKQGAEPVLKALPTQSFSYELFKYGINNAWFVYTFSNYWYKNTGDMEISLFASNDKILNSNDLPVKEKVLVSGINSLENKTIKTNISLTDGMLVNFDSLYLILLVKYKVGYPSDTFSVPYHLNSFLFEIDGNSKYISSQSPAQFIYFNEVKPIEKYLTEIFFSKDASLDATDVPRYLGLPVWPDGEYFVVNKVNRTIGPLATLNETFTSTNIQKDKFTYKKVLSPGLPNVKDLTVENDDGGIGVKIKFRLENLSEGPVSYRISYGYSSTKDPVIKQPYEPGPLDDKLTKYYRSPRLLQLFIDGRNGRIFGQMLSQYYNATLYSYNSDVTADDNYLHLVIPYYNYEKIDTLVNYYSLKDIGLYKNAFKIDTCNSEQIGGVVKCKLKVSNVSKYMLPIVNTSFAFQLQREASYSGTLYETPVTINKEIPSLRPGESINIETAFPIPVQYIGGSYLKPRYKISVKIDPERKIVELDRRDNYFDIPLREIEGLKIAPEVRLHYVQHYKKSLSGQFIPNTVSYYLSSDTIKKGLYLGQVRKECLLNDCKMVPPEINYSVPNGEYYIYCEFEQPLYSIKRKKVIAGDYIKVYIENNAPGKPELSICGISSEGEMKIDWNYIYSPLSNISFTNENPIIPGPCPNNSYRFTSYFAKDTSDKNSWILLNTFDSKVSLGLNGPSLVYNDPEVHGKGFIVNTISYEPSCGSEYNNNNNIAYTPALFIPADFKTNYLPQIVSVSNNILALNDSIEIKALIRTISPISPQNVSWHVFLEPENDNSKRYFIQSLSTLNALQKDTGIRLACKLPAGLSEGMYNVVFEINCGNKVFEINYNDNLVKKSLSLIKPEEADILPKLTIRQLQVKEEEILQGTFFNVSSRISNTGNGSADNVITEYIITGARNDNNYRYTVYDTFSIEPFRDTILNKILLFPTHFQFDDYKLTLKLHHPKDSTWYDNALSIDLPFKYKSTYDAYIRIVAPLTGYITKGQDNVLFPMEVTNLGQDVIDTLEVDLYYVDLKRTQDTVFLKSYNYFNIGRNILKDNISAFVSDTIPKMIQFIVKADPRNLIFETNEANNQIATHTHEFQSYIRILRFELSRDTLYRNLNAKARIVCKNETNRIVEPTFIFMAVDSSNNIECYIYKKIENFPELPFMNPGESKEYVFNLSIDYLQFYNPLTKTYYETDTILKNIRLLVKDSYSNDSWCIKENVTLHTKPYYSCYVDKKEWDNVLGISTFSDFTGGVMRNIYRTLSEKRSSNIILDSIYISKDAIISPDDSLLVYRHLPNSIYLENTPLETPLKVSKNYTDGTYYVIIKSCITDEAYYYWDYGSSKFISKGIKLADHPPIFNRILFRKDGKSDLTVSLIKQPDSLVEWSSTTGQNIIASYIIKDKLLNPATAYPANAYKQVYLSTDKVLSVDDLKMGGVSVLNTNKIIQIREYEIQNVPPGNYYLIIKADINNAVGEYDETNNIAVSENYFTIKHRFSITNPASLFKFFPLNDTLYTDEWMRINTKVKNDGFINIPFLVYKVSFIESHYVYSKEYFFNTVYEYYDTIHYNLKSNEFLEIDKRIYVPNSLKSKVHQVCVEFFSGSYSLGAPVKKRYNVLHHTYPDLNVSTVANHIIYNGYENVIRLRVQNIGDSLAAPSRVELYCSNSEVINESSLLLFNEAIPSLKPKGIHDFEFVYKPQISKLPDEYCLIAQVKDTLNKEFSFKNNYEATWINVVDDLPDLQLRDAKLFKVSALNRYILNAYIINNSPYPVKDSIMLEIRYHNDNFVLNRFVVSGIQKDTAVNIDFYFTLPDSILFFNPSFDLYVDANTIVAEVNEQNNIVPIDYITDPDFLNLQIAGAFIGKYTQVIDIENYRINKDRKDQLLIYATNDSILNLKNITISAFLSDNPYTYKKDKVVFSKTYSNLSLTNSNVNPFNWVNKYLRLAILSTDTLPVGIYYAHLKVEGSISYYDKEIVDNTAIVRFEIYSGPDSTSFIQSREIGNKILVYPQPMDEILTIESEKQRIGELLILDIHGKELKNIIIDDFNYELYVGELPKGIYILILKEQNKVFKLIK